MEFRITRRELVAGCLTGLGLSCLGFVLPQMAFAKAEKEAYLESFETESVAIDGISFDLPKGYKFTPKEETSSGVDQYEGLINGDVYYAMAGFSEGSKWLAIKPDELASKEVNLEGYSRNTVKQYKTDDFDSVAFFFRNEESPDLNAALLFVYGNDETWRFDIYAKSLAGNDEAAVDVIKQIIMSVKPEKRVTKEETGTSNANWRLDYFVDEFGRKSDSPFKEYWEYTSLLPGDFSNSVVSNESCYFNLFVTPVSQSYVRADCAICFRIYEYGEKLVKADSSEPRNFDIKILDSNEEVYETHGSIEAGGDYVMISPTREEGSKYTDMLLQGGPITFLATENCDYGASTYRFTLYSTDGLKDMIDAYLAVMRSYYVH